MSLDKILRSLLEKETKITGSNFAKFESRHRSVDGMPANVISVIVTCIGKLIGVAIAG